MLAENLTGRAMRGLIAIERDLMRQSPLAPESPSEEHLGRGDVSLGAKQNIDGLSLFVDSTIEIGPATLDFDVGFVDAPGLAHRASKAVPALFEFRRKRWIHRMIVVCASESPRSAIISTRSRKLSLYRKIPAHAEHDDLPVEMAAFEKIVNVNMLGHVHRGLIYRRICATPTLRTRTRHLDVFTRAPVGLVLLREKGHAAWATSSFRHSPVQRRFMVVAPSL